MMVFYSNLNLTLVNTGLYDPVSLEKATVF